MRPTAMHIHFLMYIKDYINRDLNSKSTISFIRNCGRAPQRCPAAIFICFCFLSIPETPVVLLPFRKTPGFSEVRTLQTVPDPPPARPDVLYFLSACYSPVPPCTCFSLTHPAVPGACSFRLLTTAFPSPGSAAASGSAVSPIAPGGAPAGPPKEIR